MNGFGTLDVAAGAASSSVSNLRPACGPTAMQYCIDAAGLFRVNYPGGTGLTSGSVFGQLAGAAAAGKKQ